MAVMCSSCDGSRGRLRVLGPDQIARFCEIQKELNEALDKRTAEVSSVLMPVIERLKEIKFITCTPGAQFTASFKPIIRAHPREYFGPLYEDFDLTILKQVKLTILWMRSRKHRGPNGELLFAFAGVDMNIVRKLFYWLNRSYVESFMLADAEMVRPPVAQIREVDPDDMQFCIKASFTE
jgi:hypothetical protein